MEMIPQFGENWHLQPPKNKALAGTVIYGASRDINGIKKLDYPVFSRDIIPNAGKPLAEGEINIPVICGGTTVNPGDLIMGDECGVVSVPFEIIEEVIEGACKILNNEDRYSTSVERWQIFPRHSGN